VGIIRGIHIQHPSISFIQEILISAKCDYNVSHSSMKHIQFLSADSQVAKLELAFKNSDVKSLPGYRKLYSRNSTASKFCVSWTKCDNSFGCDKMNGEVLWILSSRHGRKDRMN